MKRRSFTLIEVLVTLSIFLMVMGLVLGLVITSFRNLREGEKFLGREQRQRLCLFRLSKEISSLVRMPPPNVSFVGSENSFFFVFAKEDNLVESGYVCNLADFALEHYYEEPADFDNSADSPKQICISELSECKFSYSDGKSWKATWEERTDQIPRMVKINFKFKNETREREFVVNIPISP